MSNARKSPQKSPQKSQIQIYRQVERKIADINLFMMDMLYGDNPITDAELKALIAKRPEVYGRFKGYLGKRPTMAASLLKAS